jgi:hypothetical protein
MKLQVKIDYLLRYVIKIKIIQTLRHTLLISLGCLANEKNWKTIKKSADWDLGLTLFITNIILL